MKILYWNVNGFYKHEAKEEFRALCVRHRLDYVCIFQPKILITSVSAGYQDSLQLVFVTANNMGLNLLPSIWVIRSVRADVPGIVTFTAQQVFVMIDEASTPMLLTFVYASTYLVRRRDLWAQLVALNELDKA